MDRAYLRRRYLVSFETHRLPHIFTDVLVIGAGAAGMRAAIEAAQYGQVILLSKTAVDESNSAYAQGGIAAVLDENDTPQSHVDDTLVAGADLCDEPVVREVVEQAPEHIREMVEWGAAFDREAGDLALTREGGHHARRIVHAHGDATGREVVVTLVRKARSCQNLKIFENCFAIDLITDPVEGGPDAACLGVLSWHERYGPQLLWARQTILATGGAGVLWRETTNPPLATADGHAMAFRAGVSMADMEMMQFHPTTLYIAGASRSLISEAVRGEGGKLLDRHGKRFMPEYHPLAELAPRDIVARAIVAQMAKTGSTFAQLDVRHMGTDGFATRFPAIYEQLQKFDIDPGTDLIPVRPAAHYMIGGARTDLDGRTSVGRLFACGEASCSGLHGANRLGSNSLIEALVFGRRCGRLAGEALADESNRLAVRDLRWQAELSRRTELDLADIRNSLRAVMWRNVGLARHAERLVETCEIIDFWNRYVLDKEFRHPAGWELQNMLTVSRVIAQCALQRTESRGVHFREDFPGTDPAWRRHQIVRRSREQLVVF